MAPPQPAADFDEGIFLIHLNKGQELLGRGSLEEARQELEKARSLRPDQDKVLNLLGMLYFRMERHREALEVYRQLIALHPEESILHSNVGILEFKGGRPDEAEKHLRRALELDPSNTKPHSYLGLIYNNRDDLDRAADHFRFAGMAKMIEKVEQKRRQRAAADTTGRGMARGGADFRVHSDEATRSVPVVPPASAASPSPPLPEPLAGGIDIDSVLAGLSALGEGPAAPPGGGGAGPAAPLAPSGEDLLSGLLSSVGGLEPPPGARVSEPRPPAPRAEPPRSSAPQAPRSPAPAPLAPMGAHAGVPLDLGAAPVSAARLGTHAFGPFRRPGPGLIEMQVGGKSFIRRGSVTHYSGRLDFQRDRGSGLILVQGQGSLFLAEDDAQALLVELAGHTLTVSSAHLLSFGEGIQLEGAPLRLGPGESGLRALRLGGHGCVALTVRGETICLDVEADRPTAADPRLVVAWSGDLRAEVNASEILREVMAASAQGLLSVRFEGKGTVLVGQPLAPAARS